MQGAGVSETFDEFTVIKKGCTLKKDTAFFVDTKLKVKHHTCCYQCR